MKQISPMARMAHRIRVAGRIFEVLLALRQLSRAGRSRARTFLHRRPVLSTALGVGLGVVLARPWRRR